MKILSGISFLFLLTCSTFVYAQAPVDTAYIYTYGGKANDGCNQIRRTADKGFILLGTTSSFGSGNTSMYAVKTDSACRFQWSNVFGGMQNQAGYSVVPTSDKGYAFLGYTNSFGHGGYDAYLVKTDAHGNIRWEKTYGGSDWDFGYSLQQTQDSGFIFCGLTFSSGSGNGDVFLVRTDKNGDTLWTRSLGGSGYDAGNSLVVQGDTLYTLVGATTSLGKGDTNILFMQVDSHGIVKNTKTFGCSHNSVAYSIAPALDGGYLINGSMDTLTPGIRGPVLLKTDAKGNLNWMLPPNSTPYQDIGKDAIQAPDYTLLCVSAANGGGYGSSSMHITHLDSAGNYLAWPSFGGNNDQYGHSVTMGAHGNVLFAGESSSYGAGNYDMYVVRFSNDSIVQNYFLSITSYADTTLPAAGINEHEQTLGINVYPNPMSSGAEIRIQSERADRFTLNLFDVKGKCVREHLLFRSMDHNLSVLHLDRGNLPAGSYLYEIEDAGKRVGGGKLIVE